MRFIGNGIIPSAAKRVAAKNPPGCHPGPPYSSIPFYGSKRILGTCGPEAACGWFVRTDLLSVKVDQSNQHFFHHFWFAEA